MTTEARALRYKELMRQVEQLVASLDVSADPVATIRQVTEEVIARFGEDLKIVGGWVFRRRGPFFVHQATLGGAREARQRVRLPADHPRVQEVLESRTLFVDGGEIWRDCGVGEEFRLDKFAAIEVGEGEFLLAFQLGEGHKLEDIFYSLTILRFSINQKIRHDHLADVVRQALVIQTSILPRRIPTYEGLDLYGKSVPLESVGGDFYSYIPITDKILGLAMADVSGHGLPAALLVRDVHMGLRMGLGQDFKVVRVIERLNHIIHQGTLTSRFVSLFYGELEPNGVFIYVNAGHPPPFLVRPSGEVEGLEEGGPVLGPIPGATYERGFVKLRSGDLMVFYTDGIVEARCRTPGSDELHEFGSDRLLDAVRAHRAQPARRIVEAIFEAVERFTVGCPAEDDRTLLVVKRKG